MSDMRGEPDFRTLPIPEMEARIRRFNRRVSEAQQARPPSKAWVRQALRREGSGRCPVRLNRLSADVILRHGDALADLFCEFPDDVCLQFGPFAKFVKERGFGREITRAEAYDILKKSADAGLIHTSSNTRDRIDFICNCCTCCCGILKGVSLFNAPVRTVSSNYEARIEPDECTGCGECVEKCQMQAITLEADIAEMNLERCIGCGICVYLCPAGALSLVSRSDFVEPPRSFRELIERQAASRMQNE